MPMARKTPRLWLRPARGARRAAWFILDSGRQMATGCAEHERAEAQEALRVYMRDVFVPAEPYAGMRLSTSRHYGFVYFISTTDVPEFPVKIGYAKNDADMRMKTLQTACPYRLVVLATVRGSRGTEAAFHNQFAVSRMKGEWFQRSPALMDAIAVARHNGSANA